MVGELSWGYSGGGLGWREGWKVIVVKNTRLWVRVVS